MELKTSLLFTFSLLLLPFFSHAIDASMRYRSPRNPERKIRASTELIVLHTTEAPARSSLTKVSDRGECHYCVTEEGTVYAIVDRDREAFHAGRSMWKGKEDVDKFSIGIECVGYHNKAMPSVQVTAIAKLVKELQSMYRISDACVVCHSHVAYGAPNKWHKCKHRGRKRCGMLFSMPSMRQQLGLKAKPAYDPDVRARRLVQADPYLAQVLYGKVDTMRGAVASAPAENTSSGGFLSWFKKTTNATSEPTPQIKTSAPAPKAKPKTAIAAKNPTNGKPTTSVPPKSVAELKARGYRQAGTISKSVNAMKLAGKKWNAADTYYTIRNKVIAGNKIDDAHIENGMCVWIKK